MKKQGQGALQYEGSSLCRDMEEKENEHSELAEHRVCEGLQRSAGEMGPHLTARTDGAWAPRCWASSGP